LADLFAKYHFLLNGLGWSSMPLRTVTKDLREERLSVSSFEDGRADTVKANDFDRLAANFAINRMIKSERI
jgi:hypothetical protein